MRDGERDVNGRGLDGVARGEHGPVSDSAEHELKAEQDFEITRGVAQVFDFAEAAADGEDCPKNHAGDDDCADDVRDDAEGVVTKGGAEDDLQQNQDGSPNRERAQVWSARIIQLRQIAQPPAAGEDRDADDGDEKQFGERGVGGGNGRRQEEFYSDAAENALRDNEAQSGPGKITDPGTRFPAPCPNGENDGENADERGDHAMAVLVHDSADHGRKKRAVRKRPVGYGEASVVAGDEGSRDQEKKRATRGENGKAMKIAIPCFSQKMIVLGYEIRKCKELV